MFFLIPIGHEATWVRRWPIVTFVLMGLMILVYMIASITGWDHPSVSKKELEKFFETLSAYPCVKLSAADWEQLQRKHPGAGGFFEKMKRELSSDSELRWATCEALRHGKPAPEGRKVLLQALDEMAGKLSRNIFNQWGFIPSHPTLWTLFSHMFVHAGIFHLLGNLLFFWVSSYALEDVWGRIPFTLLFLTSGLAAVLFYSATTQRPDIPLVGASGAIAGLMGAFFVRMGHVRIKMLFVYWVFFRVGAVDFWLKARIFLGLWFLKELFNFIYMSKLSAVAFAAHLGGFAWGALAAWVIRKSQLEARVLAPRIEKKVIVAEADPLLVEAGNALTDGDVVEARRYIQRYLQQHPDDIDGWLLAFDIARRIPDRLSLQVAVEKLFEFALKGQEEGVQAVMNVIHEIRDQCQPEPSARALHKVVQHLIKQRDFKGALTVLEWIPNASQILPPAMVFQWVRMYLERGWRDKADALLQQTRHRWENDPFLAGEAEQLLKLCRI